ncbi:MAG: Na-translocating system protein MpsB, partial [Planctomycetota bacterium]|nr:Na-translocating system protein MpsB [Planctomycetota bacterium]
MSGLAVTQSGTHAQDSSEDCDVAHAIQHAAHLLPSQGPIEVFVHHNTLHAFEHLPFDEAVAAGLEIHGANPYLSESQYRSKLDQGRICIKDIESALLEDLGDDADRLVASLGTRYALRLAILQFPLQTGDHAELSWAIAETNALRKFRGDVPALVRRRVIENIKRWMTSRESQPSVSPRADLSKDTLSELISEVLPQFGSSACQSWSDRTWEAFTLQFLWQVCTQGVLSAEQSRSIRNGAAGFDGKSAPTRGMAQVAASRGSFRFGMSPAKMTGSVKDRAVYRDMQEAVNSLLIQFCSNLLDQGFASWELPSRDNGLYDTFLRLYSQPYCSPTPWLAELYRETTRIFELRLGPIRSIQESFTLLGVEPSEREKFIEQMLLALPGWAGMIWQMETNAEWAVHPAPAGSLTEYLAVRLIVERVAGRVFARDLESAEEFPHGLSHHNNDVSSRSTSIGPTRSNGSLSTVNLQRAFSIFQLAQVRGWDPRDLHRISPHQWLSIISEIEAFSPLERRRIYHHAFEKKYRDDALNALIANAKLPGGLTDAADSAAVPTETHRAKFQLVCCIDDREESFRRHLEEVEPQCETFGVAGFYGIAMYYRGVMDAHFRPLCPVNIKLRHYVTEEPTYSVARMSERQAATRRRIGRATHQAHLGSRTVVG